MSALAVPLCLALALTLAACAEPASAGGAIGPAGPDFGPDPRAPAEGPIDETSLFLLDLALDDQDGRPFRLVDRRGHPTLVAFFYASCRTTCPRVIADVRALDVALSPGARDSLRVVLVTIDPERDDPARLRELATERRLPLDRWSLVGGSERDTRALASTLGMTYRRTPDGEVAHSTLFTLLDGEGRAIAQALDGRGLGTLAEAIERAAGGTAATTDARGVAVRRGLNHAREDAIVAE